MNPTLHQPGTLAECLKLLANLGETKKRPALLAGGTDIMVSLNAGSCPWSDIIALHRLGGELDFLQWESKILRIGALCRYSRLLADSQFGKRFPLLRMACKVVGAAQIQNRGTLAGNIANGSPAGDTLPPLLVYGATVVLTSKSGSREVLLEQFFTGYRTNAMLPTEMIHEIRLPLPATKPQGFLFKKIAGRAAQAISKAIIAGEIRMADGTIAAFPLALGAVAPVPLRLRWWENHFVGRKLTPALARSGLKKLMAEIRPIDDIRSTAEYRKAVVGRTLERWMEEFF